MHPPKISHANLNPVQQDLVGRAKSFYQSHLAHSHAQSHKPPAYIACAPGRVNLIGEHTDYQNGFVLPFCLADYFTVVYGTGYLHTGKSSGNSTIHIRMISEQADDPALVEERKLSGDYTPPAFTDGEQSSWVNYVLGTIVQYRHDMPKEGCVLDLAMSFASNVPLGAGLSSSAALEVATAAFLECFLHDGMAYSAAPPNVDTKITRALRCQTAENEWANSPCGIMDQFVVSCGLENHVMLLDCRSLEPTHVPLKKERLSNAVAMLITNSQVAHSIANDSEYGKRRRECNDAVQALQSVPFYHVESLRDATVGDINTAKEKGKLDDLLYKRAHHVITENLRTKECCMALKLGLYEKVGTLMNASHQSLSQDYQVSCPELDFLQSTAVAQTGVYGSRMTGGGFGGCIVSLVDASAVDSIVTALKSAYAEQFDGKDCPCFVTHPGAGARVLAIDMDIGIKPTTTSH
jgi:galactokinase